MPNKKNTTLSKIVAEAKRIQLAHPNMKWTNAIKDASKHIKEGAKTIVSKTKTSKKTINGTKKYDLFFGSFGNGTSVYNKLEQEHGDYKFIAHISENGRSIDYKVKNLPESIKRKIEAMAKSDAKEWDKKNSIGVGKTKGTQFSIDELKFIQSEIKNSKGYKYRGKLLFGQFVVLKETEKGTPIKKWIVESMEIANAISHELNTQKKYKKIKSSKI